MRRDSDYFPHATTLATSVTGIANYETDVGTLNIDVLPVFSLFLALKFY